MSDQGKLKLEGVFIEDCVSTTEGGAVLVKTGAEVEAVSCTFKGCS